MSIKALLISHLISLLIVLLDVDADLPFEEIVVLLTCGFTDEPLLLLPLHAQAISI